jgi:PAS domain-containing protein
MPYKVAVLNKDIETLEFIKKCLDETDFIEYNIFKNITPYIDDISASDLILIDECCFISHKTEIEKIKNPILVMIPRDHTQIEDFDFDSLYSFIICDFIRKPFSKNVFVNKIKLLLKISDNTKSLDIGRLQILNNLWSLLNYSNLYVVVFDNEWHMQLINWPLSRLLGFSNEKDATGQKWLDYVSEHDLDLVEMEHNLVKEKKKPYSELTHDINTIDGVITVKWFSTFVNSTVNWTLSIGVPVSKDITSQDNIDALRAYYKDILSKDKLMIQSIKEVAMKSVNASSNCRLNNKIKNRMENK